MFENPLSHMFLSVFKANKVVVYGLIIRVVGNGVWTVAVLTTSLPTDNLQPLYLSGIAKFNIQLCIFHGFML